MNNIDNFKKVLDSLVGMPLFKFGVGPGTGTIITLDFGKQYVRHRRSPSGKEMVFGDIDFMAYCPWRVENKTRILYGSCDLCENCELILENREQLYGRKVIGYELNIFFDLAIQLEDDFTIKLFCDLANGVEYSVNYCLILANKHSFSVEGTELTYRRPDGSLIE